MTQAFTRLATSTATTARNPAMSGGKVGQPSTYITALDVLPVMPVSPEILERYKLQSARETFVTYTEGSPDVLEGDTLTVDGKTYRVKGVGEWPSNLALLEIVIERIKGA